MREAEVQGSFVVERLGAVRTFQSLGRAQGACGLCSVGVGSVMADDGWRKRWRLKQNTAQLVRRRGTIEARDSR